jgi:hypothetical protein
MNLPALYARVGYDSARREMLSDARPLDAALGELSPWWVTPSALVCFTDVGPWRPGPVHHSFFRSARRLEWVAPPGAPSLALGHYPSIPREVRARENAGRALYLFARGPEDDFTYLGEMAPSCGYGGNAETQRATFELHRTVPSAVLATLGVLSAEPGHPESLDEGLHSLAERPLARRVELLTELPYAGWRLPCLRTRFFASGGAFAVIMSDRDDQREGSVRVGAKTEHPLRFLQATDPKLWEHAAF